MISDPDLNFYNIASSNLSIRVKTEIIESDTLIYGSMHLKRFLFKLNDFSISLLISFVETPGVLVISKSFM